MAESLPNCGDKKIYCTRSRKRSLEAEERDQLPKCVAVEKEEISKNESEENSVPDCAICLQSCVHPARLPCGHIFCFLCIKGVVHSGWRCAMCRSPIPHDYLDSPQLLVIPKLSGEFERKTTEGDTEEEYQWFYEGRHGWWRYDERANTELEMAFNKSEDSITLLIAGYLYEVDLIDLIQIRKSEPNRRRRIKRDVFTAPSKGIAGLRENSTDLADAFNRMALSDRTSPSISD